MKIETDELLNIVQSILSKYLVKIGILFFIFHLSKRKSAEIETLLWQKFFNNSENNKIKVYRFLATKLSFIIFLY